MHLVSFPTDNKDRNSVKPLDYIYLPPIKHVSVLTTLLHHYNTCFSSTALRSRPDRIYHTTFKQGTGKHKYLVQADFKDTHTHFLVLDIDRWATLNHTAIDRNKVLTHLQQQINSAILWMPSASQSTLFKGRVFIPLQNSTSKELLEKFITNYFAFFWSSGFGTPLLSYNVGYLLGYKSTPKRKHEFLDRVAFLPAQKLNTYRYNSHLFEEYGDIVRLQASHIQTLTTKWETPTILTTHTSIEEDARYANMRFDALKLKELSRPAREKRIRDFGNLLYDYDTLFSDEGGNFYTYQELVDKGEEMPLRVEPTDRTDDKLPLRFYPPSTLMRFDGGDGGQFVTIKPPPLDGCEETIFTLDKNKKEYIANIPGFYDYLAPLTFIKAPTGSGKNYAFRYRPNTIMIVPRHSIKDDMGEGFLAVESGDALNLPESSKETLVMTHHKLAGHLKNKYLDLSNYSIIIDEVHNIYPTSNSRYDIGLGTLSSTVQEVERGNVKSIIMLSANYDMYEQSRHLVGDAPHTYINISYINLPTVEIALPYTVTEKFKNGKTKKPKTFPSVPPFAELGRCAVYMDAIDAAQDLKTYLKGLGLSVAFVSKDTKEQLDFVSICDVTIFTSYMREGLSLTGDFDTSVCYTTKNKGNNPTGAREAIQALSRARSVKRLIVIHGGGNQYTRTPTVEEYTQAAEAFARSTKLGGKNVYRSDSVAAITRLPGLEKIHLLFTGDPQEGYSVHDHLVRGVVSDDTARLEMNNLEEFETSLGLAGYPHKRITLQGDYKKQKTVVVKSQATNIGELRSELAYSPKELAVLEKKIDNIEGIALEDTIHENTTMLSSQGVFMLCSDPGLYKVFCNRQGIEKLREIEFFKPRNVSAWTSFMLALYKSPVRVIAKKEIKILQGKISALKVQVTLSYLKLLGLNHFWADETGLELHPVLGGYRNKQITDWENKNIKVKTGRIDGVGADYPTKGYLHVVDPQQKLNKLYATMEVVT